MEFRVIIPARYDSERLPGKVLLDIAGKPMLQHVYERAIDSGASSVVIATDDDRIEAAAEKFGATVCRTTMDHQSGTERVAEAVSILEHEKDDIIVGLQADQPLIPVSLITSLAQDLEAHDHAKVATMAKKITDPKTLLDPNVVKVVLNHRAFAIYFSRALIPWSREHFADLSDEQRLGEALALEPALYYRHIGIYAFRAGFLDTYVEWSPSPIERIESLEQLRILWHGYKMHVGLTTLDVPPGVDTKADLDTVSRLV